MKILDALRHRRAPVEALGDEAVSPDADELPIAGYDKLDHSQVATRLDRLSQVELAAVEDYERSHENRAEVLDKLRYMRTDEPLPGYDALSPEQITEALVGADAATVKGVRDYERKFRHRPAVMDETARILPTAKASADEVAAREAREARVREGFASRKKTVSDMSD